VLGFSSSRLRVEARYVELLDGLRDLVACLSFGDLRCELAFALHHPEACVVACPQQCVPSRRGL